MDNLDSLVDHYVKIDLYSGNKLEDSQGDSLGKTRIMGKNDLWIGACASASQATLITLDGDFQHLVGKKVEGLFLDVKDYSYLKKSEN